MSPRFGQPVASGKRWLKQYQHSALVRPFLDLAESSYELFRGRSSGDAIRVPISPAPADSPNTVT